MQTGDFSIYTHSPAHLVVQHGASLTPKSLKLNSKLCTVKPQTLNPALGSLKPEKKPKRPQVPRHRPQP